MRIVAAILAVLIPGVVLRAQDPTHNPQIFAAIADARESLRNQVLSANVTPSLGVRELIDKTGGDAEFTKCLQAAQQIGGTRWLDDQTAQVRLVIDGAPVAQALIQIVEKNPAKSPISLDAITTGLAKWSSRSFAATGTSTGASDTTRLQPPSAATAWANVPAADRNRALAAARENAATRTIDSLRPIELSPGQTLDSVLSVPEINTTLTTWLASRPVTSVEFRDDLSIRMTLSAPPEELWPVLHTALAHQKLSTLPTTDSGWSQLQRQVETHLMPAVGIGLVQTATTAPQAENLLPDFAPPWATRQLQAEATSPTRGSKLHTSRVAEALAIENLRHQAEALKLRDDLTLGQAAKRNSRIEHALTKALDRANPYQVDYGDHAVTVRVNLRLSDLWTQLSDRR